MKRLSLIYLLVLCLTACTLSKQDAEPLHKAARIFPDYAGVVFPINMAAPTFALKDSSENLESVQAVFSAGKENVVVGSEGDDGICISSDDWKGLVSASHHINVRLQGEKNGKWVEYDPFEITISEDSIDNTLVYRLIEPGYEVWNEMGIYQRDIECYDEEPILTNEQTDKGCMNCHSFCNYNPERMMLHLRLNYAGTYVKNGSEVFRKLSTPKSLVYPSWHRSGKFIAFSQNDTKQMFHTTDRNRIEVFDFSSDIVVYDMETDSLISSPFLSSKDKFVTFPNWSADGKTLYFCSADSVKMPDDYDKAHYSLCSISFDEDKSRLGDTVKVIYDARMNQKSVSFPRCSPDGKLLVFTLSDYGNFSIWHRESRLMQVSLEGANVVGIKPMLPEFRASYHAWSSNSRWMVIASRQDDGLYTRPYLIHVNAKGEVSKPFLLPQADASYYLRKMKSYNIPEFVKGKVSVDLRLR